MNPMDLGLNITYRASSFLKESISHIYQLKTIPTTVAEHIHYRLEDRAVVALTCFSVSSFSISSETVWF